MSTKDLMFGEGTNEDEKDELKAQGMNGQRDSVSKLEKSKDCYNPG